MHASRPLILGALLLLPAYGAARADDLPADAQKQIAAFEKQADDIHTQADRQIQALQDKLVASLKSAHDRYVKAGKTAEADAIAAEIDRLQGAGTAVAQPDPGNLAGFRARNGKSLYFEVTGDKNGGQVWGTDVYTDDSSLAAAAVHAGALKDGQKGVVKVTILGGAPSYKGTARNGVVSSDYAAWEGSYRVEVVKK